MILCSYERGFRSSRPLKVFYTTHLFRTVHSDTNYTYTSQRSIRQRCNHCAQVIHSYSSTTVYNCTHLSSCVSWGVVDRTQLPKLGNGPKRNIDNKHTARNLPTNTQWTDIINITSATFILVQDDRPLRTKYSY